MLLKLNNGEVTIKVRLCADGRKQRNWLSKEDNPLPTVYTEDTLISCMMNAMEVQDVATSDVQGAFLQNGYYKVDIHINMEGEMSTILEEIDPYY